MLAFAVGGIHATARAQSKPKQSRDRDKIELDEVRSHPSTNVYQLIKSARPHWLSTRGLTTLQTVRGANAVRRPTTMAVTPERIVYVDNSRFGTHASLRSLQSDDVASLEYLNANAATQRFGTGHAHGAILVYRRLLN